MEKKTPLDVARSYNAAHGLPPLDETASTLVPDPAKSAETARLYEKLKHSPNNPKVRAAYEALARETKAQFLHAQKMGMAFTPWTRGGQPYADSDHMRADVKENDHLFYFPGGDMAGDHPLAATDPETGLRYNDMFRAVHDYFAHSVHPHQFGPRGEIRAWNEHAKMFTPLARLAMTAETHGQNSWVNFGPHADLPVRSRPYAEQKATLMPVTQHPVKLARGLADRFKSLFGAGRVTNGPRSEYDGIVHKGRTKTGQLDPDGYAKVAAERSAVAQALQRLGSQTLRTDPAKHRQKVNDYTNAAAWLHEQDFEGLRPILDHYRKAANQLNAPDVTNPQPDKPKPGEWPEPPNRTHYTVPNIGPAGKDLTDATVPLVRAIDRIFAATRPGHVALDDSKAPDETKLADEAKPERKARPEEPKLAIPKPKNDGFAIGLADMRKFKNPKPEVQNDIDFDPDTKPEADKIPLVNYPGEVGPTGDRWYDIHRLIEAGHGREKILAHLRDKFALTPANASATLRRYFKNADAVKKTPRKGRLARSVTQDQITKGTDAQIGGSRFAYHLKQIAHEFATVDPTLSKMANHALTLNHRFKLDPRSQANEGPDDKWLGLYDRIGTRLRSHVEGVADGTHKAMVKALRAGSPESGSDYDTVVRAKPKDKRAALVAAESAPDRYDRPFDPAYEWKAHRARAAARHFSGLYNWDKIDDGLALDRHVANFLAKNLKGHTDTDDLHERAHRSYDLDRGAAKSRQPKWHDKFWADITKYVRDNHRGVGAKKINESLARLSDRAVERKEVGGEGWQNAFGWAPAAKHAKFSRAEQEKFRAHLQANPTDETALGAYADMIQEDGDEVIAAVHRSHGFREGNARRLLENLVAAGIPRDSLWTPHRATTEKGYAANRARSIFNDPEAHLVVYSGLAPTTRGFKIDPRTNTKIVYYRKTGAGKGQKSQGRPEVRNVTFPTGGE